MSEPPDSVEERLKNLETQIEQQGYFVHVGMILLIVETAALLVLWQERGKPNFDHIAVALTVFQTLFGLGALYGFWSLRALTREKAEQVAKAELKDIAPPIIRRMVTSTLDKLAKEGHISTASVDDMVDSISDGKEDGDGS